MTEINRYIQKLLKGNDLSTEDVARALQIITLGGATPSQASAFLTAFKMKGYTTEELAGAIQFISYKQKIAEFDREALFISAEHDNAEQWIGASLICASLNIPVYLQFQSTADMNLGQVLNLEMKYDSKKIAQCLEENNLTIANEGDHFVFRNIFGFNDELEFLNIFDVALPMSSVVSTMGVVYVSHNDYKLELKAKALSQGHESNALLIGASKKCYRVFDDKLSSFEFFSGKDGIQDSLQEKAAYLKVFLGGGDTAKNESILTVAGHLLFLVKAVESLEDGIKMARSAQESKKLINTLDSLVKITNALD